MAVTLSVKGQCLLVAAATFVLTAGQLAVRGRLTAPTTDYNEQFRMAQRLAAGEGFVCPVGPPRNDPSSWYTPGYVALMAGVMRAGGERGALTRATIRLLNVAALSVAVMLAFLVARRLLDGAVAWTAVALVLLSPAVAYKAGEIWDTHWTMLGGMAVMALLVVVRPRRWWAVIGTGVACGAAAMINPAFTLCYAVWVLYAAWKTRPAQRGRLAYTGRYAALALAGFLAAIAPWTVRNYRTFGELFYLRGNLPLEMWVGNAPWSDGYFFSDNGRRVHPVFDEAEARRMVRLGEWGYFQACRDDLRRWWRRDKGRFFRLGARRVRWFWLGRYDLEPSLVGKAVKAAGTAAPALLGLLGSAFVLWRRRRGLVLPATVLVYPLAYYATLVMVRYRLPVEPLVMILAAVGLVETKRFFFRRRRLSAAPPAARE